VKLRDFVVELVTIQTPKANKSTPDNYIIIHTRNALLLQPLFIKFPLVARIAPNDGALMPLLDDGLGWSG
jgi:hypothetical protein